MARPKPANTVKAGKRPATRTAWKPGQSGNPSGVHRSTVEVIALARECAPMAIERLKHWAEHGDARASVAASQVLLDRGYGKAPQHVTMSTDGGDPLGIAEARAAARELFKDPEARAALRTALWGAAAPVVRDVAVVPALPPVVTPPPVTIPDSDWFLDTLRQYPAARIAIAGGPRTGKTTLSARVTDRPVYHGDDHIALGWSQASEALAAQVNASVGPLLVEGVQVPRALRKGMAVDVVIWLERPYVAQTPEQSIMGKGCRTVFDEWRAANPAVPVVFHDGGGHAP